MTEKSHGFGGAHRPRIVKVGEREVIAHGLEQWRFGDLYHYAMTASWPLFIASFAGVYMAVNCLFALLYDLGDRPIANARPGFEDLFFFSIETLATVGYGDMHPQTRYGHWIATLESFTGLAITAAMTGRVFARCSRPRARDVRPQSGDRHGQWIADPDGPNGQRPSQHDHRRDRETLDDPA